jgi:hypothetical protein
MRFEKRIRALEKRYMSDPVILYFADGSTQPICGDGDFLLTLLTETCGGDLHPRQAATLKLILESVSAREPGGGHMVELLRILAQEPAELEGSAARL